MNGFRSLSAVLLTFSLVCLVGAPTSAQAQSGAVSGVIVDEEGTTLPGANVTIPGTQRGATTNANGRFTLTGLSPKSYTLRASFVGYAAQTKSVTVAAGDTTRVRFALSSDVAQLDEVVVVGYGQQEREDLTGSISSVGGEDLGRVATSSVEQALQGQVSGVQLNHPRLEVEGFLGGRDDWKSAKAQSPTVKSGSGGSRSCPSM